MFGVFEVGSWVCCVSMAVFSVAESWESFFMMPVAIATLVFFGCVVRFPVFLRFRVLLLCGGGGGLCVDEARNALLKSEPPEPLKCVNGSFLIALINANFSSSSDVFLKRSRRRAAMFAVSYAEGESLFHEKLSGPP